MAETTAAPVTATDASQATKQKPKPERLPITVSKPTPYTFDLGNLVASDPNPLTLPPGGRTQPTALNAALASTARDGAQSLLNQLLTTCTLTSTTKDGVLLTLPPRNMLTPRFKPLPTPKQPTKWELFARKKGIGKYSSKPGAGTKEAKGKMVYDAEKEKWVPRWGYGGANKKGENEWLVEVDDKEWKNEEKDAAEGKGVRSLGRRERVESIRRNERRQRANERRGSRKGA
ncbi:hypothetical protein AJ80_00428 [Polytolypa hystricis UAMH7299]|uniref:Ribosome biogenesis regulatory protein n=1 Tax=Polytolypa hystricis (strain UAMH7299) TaxID=1447883 RepID=A0A2B7Z425_POLH7|nr:hypothetical protein AJ80_00428 [Polytolypa hystricis UAMH7299]